VLQNDFDKLRSDVNNLAEKFEDLVVEFANIRRLINERLSFDQIAKLEEFIKDADRLAPLLKRLALFSEPTTKDILTRYGARPDQFAKIIEMDGRHSLGELQEMCRQRGLPTGGDKKKLSFRLIEYDERQRNSKEQ
jgi:hypothetical protein